jgi:hypothetical protein
MQCVRLSTNCLPDQKPKQRHGGSLRIIQASLLGFLAALTCCPKGSPICLRQQVPCAGHACQTRRCTCTWAHSLLGASFAYRGHPSRVLGVFSSLALAMEAPRIHVKLRMSLAEMNFSQGQEK